MLKTVVGVCRYCGNTFPVRREALGHSLCDLCLNLLRDTYGHASVARVAAEFHVGTDAVKLWAAQQGLQRRLICVTCGRPFATPNPTSQCPICLAVGRSNE